MNAFMFGQWNNWILTLNGIKNVMTTNSLRSLQGKITPQWVIKIPEWFQRSGGYGIIGKILMAKLYICVWAWAWYQMCFLVNPHKEALSLFHRRGKWNSDRRMDSPRPQSQKPWGWIQGQVSDISWTRLWILLIFKTPVICSFYSIAHNGDSLQLIFGGEHTATYIEVEI